MICITMYIAVEDVIDSPSGDQGLILEGAHRIFNNIWPIKSVSTNADIGLIPTCMKIANTKIDTIRYTNKASEVCIFSIVYKLKRFY
jgi:hypothetical protein